MKDESTDGDIEEYKTTDESLEEQWEKIEKIAYAARKASSNMALTTQKSLRKINDILCNMKVQLYLLGKASKKSSGD